MPTKTAMVSMDKTSRTNVLGASETSDQTFSSIDRRDIILALARAMSITSNMVSQKELSDGASISPSSISNALCGRENISAEKWMKILEVIANKYPIAAYYFWHGLTSRTQDAIRAVRKPPFLTQFILEQDHEDCVEIDSVLNAMLRLLSKIRDGSINKRSISDVVNAIKILLSKVDPSVSMDFGCLLEGFVDEGQAGPPGVSKGLGNFYGNITNNYVVFYQSSAREGETESTTMEDLFERFFTAVAKQNESKVPSEPKAAKSSSRSRSANATGRESTAQDK